MTFVNVDICWLEFRHYIQSRSSIFQYWCLKNRELCWDKYSPYITENYWYNNQVSKSHKTNEKVSQIARTFKIRIVMGVKTKTNLRKWRERLRKGLNSSNVEFQKIVFWLIYFLLWKKQYLQENWNFLRSDGHQKPWKKSGFGSMFCCSTC